MNDCSHRQTDRHFSTCLFFAASFIRGNSFVALIDRYLTSHSSVVERVEVQFDTAERKTLDYWCNQYSHTAQDMEQSGLTTPTGSWEDCLVWGF